MIKITKSLKSILIISFLLLMTNCATEEIGQQNISQSSNKAKIWFENHEKDYSSTVLNYVNDLQWQNAIISEGDMGEIIEVPFTLGGKLSATTKQADQYNDHHRLMFIKDGQKEFKLFYIQIFANDENYSIQDKNYNYYNIKENLDGKIFVQELSTNIGTKLEFTEGKKVQRSITAKYVPLVQECVYYGYWYEDGHFEPLYEVGCYGGGGGEPTYSEPAPGYGGSGNGSTPAPSGTCPKGYIYKLGECLLANKITNTLTGKAKCLNDLLNKNGDSFVQNLLAKFAGVSEFNILIVSKDKVTDVDSQGVLKDLNGATYPPVNNSITIEISASKAEVNSALDVARTILHEYIHADIFRKLGTNLGTSQQKLDFKTTYEAYGNQHNTIASLYLTSMKDALKQFHKNSLPDDYNKYTQYYGEEPSDAFYEALAWGGLRDNNVKAWTDLPADKKASITALANRVPMLSKTVPCP